MDDAGPSGSSSDFLRGTRNRIRTLFHLKGEDEFEDEIKSKVLEGQDLGVIQASEADMISNIFEFSDKEAGDIMTNRNQMVCVDGNLTLTEAVRFMLDENNSRFPVYVDNIDQIVGILHIRDAVSAMPIFAGEDEAVEKNAAEMPLRKMRDIIRKPMYVPETKNIDDLLREMQASKTQMVIVLDEYGQTAGLVTIEDILEEIVGNILDEYDEDEAYIEETAKKDEFLIDGKTPLEELEERFGMSFDDIDVETLNGFVISKLEHIPEEDEQFEFDEGDYHFKIVSVSNHMVQSVLVTKRHAKETETEKE